MFKDVHGMRETLDMALTKENTIKTILADLKSILQREQQQVLAHGTCAFSRVCNHVVIDCSMPTLLSMRFAQTHRIRPV